MNAKLCFSNVTMNPPGTDLLGCPNQSAQSNTREAISLPRPHALNSWLKWQRSKNEPGEASAGGHAVGMLTAFSLHAREILGGRHRQTREPERPLGFLGAKNVWNCKCISSIRKGGLMKSVSRKAVCSVVFLVGAAFAQHVKTDF